MTDKKHIERLFKEHYRQLYRLAKVLLHDDEIARDIVHDVFATLLYGANETSASAGYIFNAVRNRCLNYLRDASTHQRLVNHYLLEYEEYEAENWPDEETSARIHAIIKSELSQQCRRAMKLRFVEGLKYSEVAEAMGISETAVYKHVRHAIVTVRKKLNENG